MLNLGMLYANGKGMARDYSKAAELYRQAADAGNLTAVNNLAVLYQHGRGIPQDHAEAVRLYRQCADAYIAVGQYNLGTMYHRGIGVAHNDHEAVRWYRLAAAQNHPSAMNNLGDAYEKGCGLEQDYAKAAEWYRKAAERGVSASHYSLGVFYREGLGVEQDFREAEKWLIAAVDKGFEKAAPVLESLYAAGQVKLPLPKSEPAAPVTKPETTSASKIVSPQTAAQRALCLRALIRRGEIEILLWRASLKSGPPHQLDLDALKAEARQINEWLKDEALWLTVSDKEKQALNIKPGAWPTQLCKDAAWRAEALGVIGWRIAFSLTIHSWTTPRLCIARRYCRRPNILFPAPDFARKRTFWRPGKLRNLGCGAPAPRKFKWSRTNTRHRPGLAMRKSSCQPLNIGKRKACSRRFGVTFRRGAKPTVN